MVAANVSAELARQGVSVAVLADRTSLLMSALLRKLNGEVGFTVDEVDLIAMALGVHVSRLTGNG
jgi:lambda repressor-like predicted transcriptional regulator